MGTRMLPVATPKVPSPANATRDLSMTNGGARESSATVVLQDASPALSARLVSTRFSHAPLPPTESAVVTSQLPALSVVSSITTTVVADSPSSPRPTRTASASPSRRETGTHPASTLETRRRTVVSQKTTTSRTTENSSGDLPLLVTTPPLTASMESLTSTPSTTLASAFSSVTWELISTRLSSTARTTKATWTCAHGLAHVKTTVVSAKTTSSTRSMVTRLSGVLLLSSSTIASSSSSPPPTVYCPTMVSSHSSA